MENNHQTRNWTSVIILSLLLMAAIGMTWYFSSKTVTESNSTSIQIAKNVEIFLGEHFIIDKGDIFWKITLNEIVRKAAHFTEYLLIGLIMCSLLNVAFKKVWPAALISILTCPFLAYADEYRQKFSLGRTPRWFDVQVDTTGAIIGIIIAAICFAVFNHVKKLNNRIIELETQKNCAEIESIDINLH